MQLMSWLGTIGVIAGMVLLGLEQQYRFLPEAILGVDPVWWICGLSGLWFLVTLGKSIFAHFHSSSSETVQCHQCFWTGSPAVWEAWGSCPRCGQLGDYSYLIFGPGQTLQPGKRSAMVHYRHRARR